MTLELHTPDFFSIPPKRLKVEERDNVGRVHIVDVKADRVVAVAKLKEEER